MKLRDLRKDKDFLADVDECLKNIMELPSLKKQMQTMFSELEDLMIDQKATQSTQAANKVRHNLARSKILTRLTVLDKIFQEEQYEKNVNKIVEETCRTNAARAMRISKLLTKKWFE